MFIIIMLWNFPVREWSKETMAMLRLTNNTKFTRLSGVKIDGTSVLFYYIHLEKSLSSDALICIYSLNASLFYDNILLQCI